MIKIIANNLYSDRLEFEIQNSSFSLKVESIPKIDLPKALSKKLIVTFQSNTEMTCQQLWESGISAIEFIMLFAGSFPKIKQIIFLDSSGDIIHENEANNFKEKMLDMYSTHELFSKPDLVFNFDFTSDNELMHDLYIRWEEFKKEFNPSHKVFLNAISNNILIDIRLAHITAVFESLFEFLNKKKLLSIQCCCKADHHLRCQLETIIKTYDDSIFDQLEKSIMEIKHNRNNIFHAKSNNEKGLPGNKCSYYSYMLYLLYRKIVLNYIGLDQKCDYGYENAKRAVEKIFIGSLSPIIPAGRGSAKYD